MTGEAKSSRGRRIARRTFLVAAGVVGGGLLVGAGVTAVRLAIIDRYRLPAGDGEASFGAWLKIARDGKIEVAVPHQEMGQGIYALAALLAAEGLQLPIDAVRAVQAPIDVRFAIVAFGNAVRSVCMPLHPVKTGFIFARAARGARLPAADPRRGGGLSCEAG